MSVTGGYDFKIVIKERRDRALATSGGSLFHDLVA